MNYKIFMPMRKNMRIIRKCDKDDKSEGINPENQKSDFTDRI